MLSIVQNLKFVLQFKGRKPTKEKNYRLILAHGEIFEMSPLRFFPHGFSPYHISFFTHRSNLFALNKLKSYKGKFDMSFSGHLK